MVGDGGALVQSKVHVLDQVMKGLPEVWCRTMMGCLALLSQAQNRSGQDDGERSFGNSVPLHEYRSCPVALVESYPSPSPSSPAVPMLPE